MVGIRGGTFDGLFVCCPGGTDGALARPAVATFDRRYWLLCGISHRHPGTPATLYGKHSDRSPPSPVAEGFVHIAAYASFVGRGTERESCWNILVRFVRRENRHLRC